MYKVVSKTRLDVKHDSVALQWNSGHVRLLAGALQWKNIRILKMWWIKQSKCLKQWSNTPGDSSVHHVSIKYELTLNNLTNHNRHQFQNGTGELKFQGFNLWWNQNDKWTTIIFFKYSAKLQWGKMTHTYGRKKVVETQGAHIHTKNKSSQEQSK